MFPVGEEQELVLLMNRMQFFSIHECISSSLQVLAFHLEPDEREGFEKRSNELKAEAFRRFDKVNSSLTFEREINFLHKLSQMI